MFEFIEKLFSPEGFVPRRICGNWPQELIWTSVISDAMIWLAYMAIPLALAYLLFKTKVKLQYNWIIWMFVAFIFLCGMTHFMGVVVFWNPLYRLDVLVKLLTAIVSLSTVVALIWLVPKALAAQSAPELEIAVGNLNQQAKYYYALIAAIVLLVGADMWGLYAFSNLRDAYAWRTHSNEALIRVELINGAFNEAESCERGYIITGDEKFLERYALVKKACYAEVADLHDFVSDNPSQVARVEAMKVPLDKRFKQFDDTIELRRGKNLDEIIKLIMSNRGVAIVAEIDRIEGEIREEELRLRDIRTAKLESESRTVMIVNILACIIGVSVIVIVFLIVIRQYDSLNSLNKRLLENIDARAKIEAELSSANKELSQFAYVASHDLKAPLRGISNLATWIEEDMAKVIEPATRKHLQQMRERIVRMNALIEGILQYSRIGRVYTKREKTDLNALVKSILEGMDKKKFTFNVEPLPTVVGNTIVLTQLFGNLLENTVRHHNRDDGKVSITCKESISFYEFSVKDDGPGIPLNLQDKLFVMFSTLNPNVGGTGIGLALCKKIVEEVGGRIWVESDAGKGAIFSFTWPKYLDERQAV